MLLVGGEIGRLNAGKVEESILVVIEEFLLCRVIVGVDAVERGVDDGLDGIETIEDLLSFIELVAGTIKVSRLNTKAGTGNFDDSVDVGVLGVGLVDLSGKCSEEGKSSLMVLVTSGIYNKTCQ